MGKGNIYPKVTHCINIDVWVLPVIAHQEYSQCASNGNRVEGLNKKICSFSKIWDPGAKFKGK